MMILWILGLLAACFTVVALAYGLAMIGRKRKEWPTDHVPPLIIIDGGKMERQWGGVEIFLRVMGRLPDQKGDTLTTQMLEDFIDKFAEHPTHGYWVPLAKKLLDEKRGGKNGRPAVEKAGEDNSTDVRDDPAFDEGDGGES